ncbi:MAG: hypothetical protein ABII02_04300 [Candidatus Magasanikbacteria bacterium]
MKKFLLILIVLILLGLGGFYLLGRFSADNVGVPSEPSEDIVTELEVVEPEEKVRMLPAEYEHDKDRDGIEDTKEEELGTSDLSADTDGDGITDIDEIEKWKTDPTKVDTDGDGFADAIEILSGYNPNGEGKFE